MTHRLRPEKYEGGRFSPEQALTLLNRLGETDARLLGADGFVETSEGLTQPLDMILDLSDTELDARSRVEAVRKFVTDHSTRAASFELVWD